MLIVAEAERNEKRLEDKMLMDTSDEQEAAPEQVEHSRSIYRTEPYRRTQEHLKEEGEKPDSKSTVYTLR